jgi:hypothetical protein
LNLYARQPRTAARRAIKALARHLCHRRRKAHSSLQIAGKSRLATTIQITRSAWRSTISHATPSAIVASETMVARWTDVGEPSKVTGIAFSAGGHLYQ